MNISQLVEVKTNPNIPKLTPGDTVKVSVKVIEGDKERIQVFRGVVIRIRNGVDGGNFTVRRVSQGIGVERTFLARSARGFRPRSSGRRPGWDSRA
ncbi:MAG: 50S ribosomal protein L19, partial [Dehalococcoidales bacterium]